VLVQWGRLSGPAFGNVTREYEGAVGALTRVGDGGDAVVRGVTGDETDQESRSAGQGAATTLTAMDIRIPELF
jgi:hypothetical protein